MSNKGPNFPPEPQHPELQGKELMIAAIGAVGFRLEQGPNAHAPEKLPLKPEQADNLPPESVE